MPFPVQLAGRMASRSLQQLIVVVDHRLRLQDLAVRNAARAVAADQVAALLRADAAAAFAAPHAVA